jgi:hypothetical protein
LSSRPALAAARSIIRAKPAVVNGKPRSLTKTKGDGVLSRWSPHLVAEQWVGAGGAILDPPHMQDRGIELHLVPAQVAEFGRPKPMPEGQQDHGRVPMPPSIGLGGLDHGLDLPGRQVLPGSKYGVRAIRPDIRRSHAARSEENRSVRDLSVVTARCDHARRRCR